MKTLLSTLLLAATIYLPMKAQNENYRLESGNESKQTLYTEPLKPVYFNFSRRQLSYDRYNRVNPRDFLFTCRSINSEAVQQQLARYDQLTRTKKVLFGAMIGTDVGGYVMTMIGGSYPYGSYYGNNYQAPVLYTGLACLFILTPALAISTSIPHQKRKEILFRDLPDAYNFYVLNTSK